MLSTTRSNRLRPCVDATLSAHFWQHFYDPSSLTVKLKQAGSLTVVLIRQGLCLADRATLEQLALSEQQTLWQRKVLLKVDGVLWIEAHTLIPLQTLSTEARHLFLLQNRPLGEWLFRDLTLRRSRFHLQWRQNLPLRQSCFHYHQSPIYLQEVFQPVAIAHFS